MTSFVLDRLADECQLMISARRLAAWVGDGRAVTPKGVLRPGDVSAAAAAMKVDVPARVRTAADVDMVHRAWVAAQAVGLLKVTTGRAVAVPASGGDRLQWWWSAVTAVLRAESHDDRRRGARILRKAPAGIRRLGRYTNERHAPVHRTLWPKLTKAKGKLLTDEERQRHRQVSLSLWIALVVDQIPPLTPA